MVDLPIHQRKGFDPNWDGFLSDMVLGVAEASASNVVESIIETHKNKDRLKAINLLELPSNTNLFELMALQVWQFKGQSWSQIDGSFIGFDPKAGSKHLQSRFYYSWWSQTVTSYVWALYDNGEAQTLYEYDEFGIGESTPPEKKQPYEEGTVFSTDNMQRYYSVKDYGFILSDDYQNEEITRVKNLVIEDCSFYVGCTALYLTLDDLFTYYEQDDVVAAYGIVDH